MRAGELSLLAQGAVGCACSSATHVQLGPWSVPVGPLTAIVLAVALLFGPAVLFGWVVRRRQARAMRDALRG